jgi:hypothetical protein
LDLYRNSFTSTIPTEISQLANAKEIMLEENFLTGAFHSFRAWFAYNVVPIVVA